MADMNYKVLIEEAMLNMVRDILKKISKDGLPKKHHFLITFSCLLYTSDAADES